MASVQLDPASGMFRIRFRFAGKAYFRSLGTTSEDEANSLCGRAELTINAIAQGFLAIPTGADPGDFILAGGKSIQPVTVIDRPKSITLDQLLTAYSDALNHDAKEANSIATEAIHRGHLTRHMGTLAVETIDFDVIQTYVDARQGDDREPVTIRKELATLRMIWNWALRRKRIASPLPWRMGDLEFSKSSAKEPFKTWAEIERRIKREKLSDDAAAELWECLYLDERQVKECLEHVRKNAAHPFVYPLFAFCAYTGARRSEILRSVRDDFDLASATVAIRQKKSDTSKHITFRHVPMHPELVKIMRAWFRRHPGSSPSICTPNGEPIGGRMATKYFRAAIADSKWKVLHGFHVFRHSLASIMASKGIDQRVINEILGHSTEDMVRRYRHLFPQKREQAMGQLFGG
jgi:integrase